MCVLSTTFMNGSFFLSTNASYARLTPNIVQVYKIFFFFLNIQFQKITNILEFKHSQYKYILSYIYVRLQQQQQQQPRVYLKSWHIQATNVRFLQFDAI